MIAHKPMQPDALSSKLTPEEIHLLLHGTPDELANDATDMLAAEAQREMTHLSTTNAAAWALYNATNPVLYGTKNSKSADSQSFREARPRRTLAAQRSRSRVRRMARAEA